MMQQENRRYGLMDWVRFIMSLDVVRRHCIVWNNANEGLLFDGIKLYSDITIPVFFAISGFFLLYGISLEEREKVDRRLTKYLYGTLKIYLFWSVIYLPYSFWGELVVYGNSLPKAVVKIIWGIAVIGSNYNSWQLWYLLALIVAVWMIRFGLRHGLLMEQITAIGAVLCVLGLYLNAVRYGGSQFPIVGQAADWYFRIFYDIRNGPLSALIYVSIGILFSYRTVSVMRLWIGAIAGCGMALLVRNNFLVYGLGVICAVVCIFGIIESIDMPVTPMGRIFRGISRYIYLSHLLFFGVFSALATGISQWMLFGQTLIATFLFSVAVILVMDYKRRKCSDKT